MDKNKISNFCWSLPVKLRHKSRQYSHFLEPILFVVVAAIIISFLYFLPHLASWRYQQIVDLNAVQGGSVITGSDKLNYILDLQKQILQALGGIAVSVGVWVALRRIKVTEAGHFTERFSKAIEHLGSEKTATQLGGIYALEKLAKERTEYHNTIFETLCAFVRENRPYPPSQTQESTTNKVDTKALVSAVVAVIGRRNKLNEYDYLIDLRDTDLSNINFSQPTGSAYFTKSNFCRSNLSNSNFCRSNLNNSNFEGALLQGTRFGYTTIKKANFNLAKLNGAFFQEAYIEEAIFSNASLIGAGFYKAELKNIDLSRAENLQEMHFQEAKLIDVDAKGGKNLKNSSFTGAVLEGVDLSRADLEDVQFFKATLVKVNLHFAQMSKTVFEEATLKCCKYRDSDFLKTYTMRNARIDDPLRDFIIREKPSLLEEELGITVSKPPNYKC